MAWYVSQDKLLIQYAINPNYEIYTCVGTEFIYHLLVFISIDESVTGQSVEKTEAIFKLKAK